MEIKINLKEIRERQGLNKNELARMSRVADSQISRIESGESCNPKLETVCKLAHALGVTLNDLVVCIKR